MSREATEVSMVWSQRRDKEEPSPGRRAKLKEQPPGEADRQAGLCGERLLATSGSIGAEGLQTRVLSNYTQCRSWVTRVSKQVRRSPQQTGSLQGSVSTEDVDFAKRQDLRA